MSSKLSVEEVLSNLEARAVFHREQQAFHVQQEAHHREQQAFHAAELAKVMQSLEAFRAVASTAVELAAPVVSPPTPAPPAGDEDKLPAAGRKMVGRLIQLAVLGKELQEPFGPVAVAAETNRRFASRLAKPVGARTASDVLRRMVRQGEILLARKGRALHEALYKRRPPRGGQ